VVVADGTVALVGAPTELPPPTSVVTPLSTRVERLAGAGDGVFAGGAGVVTSTSCWPGLAEPLAGRSPGRRNSPPGEVGMVVTLRSARELGLESTAVRGPSTRLSGPDSGGELVLTLARSAEALFDSVVAALVAASAAFAQTRKAKAMAVAVRPNR
jgi:hypothetical protein